MNERLMPVVLVSILSITCCPAQLAFPSETPSETCKDEAAAWEAVKEMWSAIQHDPKRAKLFFCERFYREDYPSGQRPPYVAFARVFIKQQTQEDKKVLVVHEQSFLPLQEQWTDYDYYKDAGDTRFKESVSVFDPDWRFLSWEEWTWQIARDDNTKLPFARHSSARSGDGRLTIVDAPLATGGELSHIDLPANLPFDPAVFHLLRIAGDAVTGRSILSLTIPHGRLGVFDISAEPGKAGWSDQPAISVSESALPRRWLGVSVPAALNLTVIPSTSEYTTSYSQHYSEFTVTSKKTYMEQLRKFMRSFSIDTFSDRDGKPVPLPLGVDEVDQSEKKDP